MESPAKKVSDIMKVDLWNICGHEVELMSQAPHLRQFGGAASSCNCDAKYDQKNQAQPLRNEDEHVSMTLLGSMQLVGFVGCCESFVFVVQRRFGASLVVVALRFAESEKHHFTGTFCMPRV